MCGTPRSSAIGSSDSNIKTYDIEQLPEQRFYSFSFNPSGHRHYVVGGRSYTVSGSKDYGILLRIRNPVKDPESQEIGKDYSWWAASGYDTIHMTYSDSIPGELLACSGKATIADTSDWDFYGKYKKQSPERIGSFEIRVDPIRRAGRNFTSAQRAAGFEKDQFELLVQEGTIYVASGQKYATFSRSSVPDSGLYDAMYDNGSGNIDKIYPLRVIGNGFRVTLSSESSDIFEQVGDLLHCDVVPTAFLLPVRDEDFYPLHEPPDDPLLFPPARCCSCEVEADSIGDHSDWSVGEEGACSSWDDLFQWSLGAETDTTKGINAFGAWGYDTISNDIVVGVADWGVWWPHPAFPWSARDGSWGADTSFVRATCDFGGGFDGVEETCENIGMPDTSSTWHLTEAHGTAMAGLIAAATNDERDMAGVCWGNIHLAPYRVFKFLHWPTPRMAFAANWQDVYWWAGYHDGCHVLSGSFASMYLNCELAGDLALATHFGSRLDVLWSLYGFREDSLCIFHSAGNEDGAVTSSDPLLNCSESPSDPCESACFTMPAALPWIEAITSSNKAGTHAHGFFHGNCGADPWMQPHGWIDLAAPPADDPIPAPHFERCAIHTDEYPFWPRCKPGTDHEDKLKYRMGKSSRTSAATALTSGVAAMVIDAYMDSEETRPGGSGSRPIPEDVYGILEHSSTIPSNDEHIPDPYEPNHHVGWGRVNAGLAVYDALYADIDHETAYPTLWSGFEGLDAVEWECPGHAAGIDSCGYPDHKVLVCPMRVTKIVTAPTAARMGIWGHHRSPTKGAMPLMKDGLQADKAHELVWYPWCDPTEFRRAGGCSLQTFIYVLYHQHDPGQSYSCPYEGKILPCVPEDVMFSYTTLSSDRLLASVEGDGGGSFGTHMRRPVLEAYPQPFNPDVSIRYAIPVAGNVSMQLYDIQGRLVRTLINREMNAGLYFITWDGCNQHGHACASGVYFCRLDVSGSSTIKKLVLLK